MSVNFSYAVKWSKKNQSSIDFVEQMSWFLLSNFCDTIAVFYFIYIIYTCIFFFFRLGKSPL